MEAIREAAALNLTLSAAVWAVLAVLLALPVFALLHYRKPPPIPTGVPALPVNGNDLVFVLSLLAVFVGFLYLQAKAIPVGDKPELVVEQILGTLIIHGGFLAVVLFFIGIVQKRSLARWFGLNEEGQASAVRQGIWVGLCSLVSLTWLGAWINAALLEPRGLGGMAQEAVKSFGGSPSVAVRIGLGFMAVIFAPIMEEVAFRGTIYPVLKRFTSAPIAALGSSLLFGSIHGNLAAFLPLSLFGLILCLFYEKTGSIIGPITAHTIFNSASLIGMLSGLGQK